MKPNLNNLRLAIKGLVTAWVPVAVALGVFHDTQTAVLVMGASTISIDLVFRVWDVGDPTSVGGGAETP